MYIQFFLPSRTNRINVETSYYLIYLMFYLKQKIQIDNQLI